MQIKLSSTYHTNYVRNWQIMSDLWFIKSFEQTNKQINKHSVITWSSSSSLSLLSLSIASCKSFSDLSSRPLYRFLKSSTLFCKLSRCLGVNLSRFLRKKWSAPLTDSVTGARRLRTSSRTGLNSSISLYSGEYSLLVGLVWSTRPSVLDTQSSFAFKSFMCSTQSWARSRSVSEIWRRRSKSS